MIRQSGSLNSPILPSDVKELFKRALAESTVLSNGVPSFSPSTFFKIWFRQYGTPFFFLFKKNLHVTNMQFAELVALLQSMMTDDSGQEVEFQFVSPKEFVSTFRNLISSFPMNSEEDAAQTRDLLAELYSDILRRIVVLSPHFGTCEVFLPANLSLNLALLCGYSGYIHSCGHNVYVRNATKASYRSLRNSLKSFLASTNYPSLRLIVFSHEDFDDQDRGRLGDLTHGLNDCKLHLEKTYLGEDRLVSAIRRLREDPELAGRIVIPEKPGEDELKDNPAVDKTRSLFMIRDFSVGKYPGTRGEDVYLILYEQLYKNLNALHYFDENKPAWITHTTTPHTLIGAMLNVTRPGWPNAPVICDPFVGTGTTILELAKYDNVKGVGRDISPLSEIVINDNRRIFSSTLTDLQNEVAFLKSDLDPSASFPLTITPSTHFVKAFVEMHDKFFELFTKDGVVVVDLDDEEMVNEAALAKSLGEYSDRERLIFYLLLKTLRRNEGALHRGTLQREWHGRFLKEKERAERNLADLVRIYSKHIIDRVGSILVIQDGYSLGCTIAPDAVLADRLTINKSGESNVESLEDNKYDVIIADPPYGFNTQKRVAGLARLYKAMIPRMIRSLKDGGQLVITLPERSYIGRRSPFFTHKEMVTQQVLNAAQEVDLEVVKSSVPEPTSLFKPPYYWRSERALARSILHFRFRRSP